MKDLNRATLVEFLKAENPGLTDEWFEAVYELGSMLGSGLWNGHYDITDKPINEMDLITNDDKYLINLYNDNDSAYALHSKQELQKVEKIIGEGVFSTFEGNLWDACSVSTFMEFVGDYIPDEGLAFDGYQLEKDLTSDNTEHYTENWFDNRFTEETFKSEVDRYISRYGSDYPENRESILIEWLAQDLQSYVNDTENSDCFYDWRAISQLELFCVLSGYPKKEDYFGVLSDSPRDDRLFNDETYLPYSKAVELVKDAVKEDNIDLLSYFEPVATEGK